jgi:hypothetical protein
MEVILIGWLILSVIVGSAAEGNGRSGFGFFLLSLIFSPFVGILVLLARGKNESALAREAVKRGKAQVCSTCKEIIKIGAIRCRYCGAEVPPIVSQSWWKKQK